MKALQNAHLPHGQERSFLFLLVFATTAITIAAVPSAEVTALLFIAPFLLFFLFFEVLERVKADGASRVGGPLQALIHHSRQRHPVLASSAAVLDALLTPLLLRLPLPLPLSAFSLYLLFLSFFLPLLLFVVRRRREITEDVAQVQERVHSSRHIYCLLLLRGTSSRSR